MWVASKTTSLYIAPDGVPHQDSFASAVLSRVTSLQAVVGTPFTRQTFLHAHRRSGTPSTTVASGNPTMPCKTLSALRKELSDDDDALLFFRSSRAAAAAGCNRDSVTPNSRHVVRPTTANSFFSIQHDQKDGKGTPHSESRHHYPTAAPTLVPPCPAAESEVVQHPRPASAMLVRTKAKLEVLMREEGSALLCAAEKEKRTAATEQQQQQRGTANALRMHDSIDDLCDPELQHEQGAVTDVWDDASIDPRLFDSAAATPDVPSLMLLPTTAAAGSSSLSPSLVGRPVSAQRGGSQPPLGCWSRPTSAQPVVHGIKRPPRAPSSSSSAALPPLSSCLSSRSVSPSNVDVGQAAPPTALIPKFYASGGASPGCKPIPSDCGHLQAHARSCSSDQLSGSSSSTSTSLGTTSMKNCRSLTLDTEMPLPVDVRPASAYADRFRKKLEAAVCGTNPVAREQERGNNVAASDVNRNDSVPRCSHQQHQSPDNAAMLITEQVAAEDAKARPISSPQKTHPWIADAAEPISSPQQTHPWIADAAEAEEIDSFLGQHFFSLKQLEKELKHVQEVLRASSPHAEA